VDLDAFVRSPMKAHQSSGDIVRIESGATFHSTVHGHSTDPNPGPRQVLG
jgi:hypothetical protein